MGKFSILKKKETNVQGKGVSFNKQKSVVLDSNSQVEDRKFSVLFTPLEEDISHSHSSYGSDIHSKTSSSCSEQNTKNKPKILDLGTLDLD